MDRHSPGYGHSHAILRSLAPQLMSHRLVSSNSFNASLSQAFLSQPHSLHLSPAHLTRSAKTLLPSSLGGFNLKDRLITDPAQIDQLLALDLPPPPPLSGSSNQLALWAGFRASLPSSMDAKHQRRKRRAQLGERILALNSHTAPLGLRENLDAETGLLGSGSNRVRNSLGGDRPAPKARRAASRRRQTDIGLSNSSALIEPSPPELSVAELQAELEEIVSDQANLRIRKELVAKDLESIMAKMSRLGEIAQELERSMLSLKEEELELVDEYQGVEDRLRSRGADHGVPSQPRLSSTSSRRRRGPAFLPSEHDELPKSVSFMTLRGHLKPISALDFSSPYGQLVSASADESLKLWDLASGELIRDLEGHQGMVKCLQIEDSTCITGGIDGQIRIWDLIKAEETSQDNASPSAQPEDDHSSNPDAPCVVKLEGHTQPVTALYFDDIWLVTGSSDKTIRQWDLNTGQAILTMDILWAMQHHHNPFKHPSPRSRQLRHPSSSISDFDFESRFASVPSSPSANPALPHYFARMGTDTQTGVLELGMDAYTDFVGGIQFWGYALASGSGDGCVRMWDMRTGQAHRTLVGHTGPITCLQFDELHLVSGSLDGSIKVWDLRTGTVEETLKYGHPIGALEFDSRKIISAAGTNALNVYNRTTMQHSLINTNGHTDIVERLRYLDRYAVTGARDGLVKVWSI